MSDPNYKIFESLGRIEAKLDDQGAKLKKIEYRVDSHEKLKNKVIGLCIGVSALITATATTVLNKLGLGQ